MNIPHSALEPFGVIGIPSIHISGNSIMHTIEQFFDVMTRTARLTNSCMKDDIRLFCSITKKLGVKLGATYVTVAVRNEIRCPTTSKLLCADLYVRVRMPSDGIHKQTFKLR